MRFAFTYLYLLAFLTVFTNCSTYKLGNNAALGAGEGIKQKGNAIGDH